MSETDLQLGGGYTYQWECAILMALNYFSAEPLAYNDTLHELVSTFLGCLEKMQLEGGEIGKNLGFSQDDLTEDRELEDINLFTGEKRILIQVKTKQKKGSLWALTDDLLHKALNKFYQRHIQEKKSENTRYVFLTNRDFNEHIQKLVQDIQAGTLSQKKDKDELTEAGKLHRYLCNWLEKNKKEKQVDFKRFGEVLAQTRFVYYQQVEVVAANIQNLLQAYGRKDFKQAYALLFTHFAKQSTQIGGGIITSAFFKEVLGDQPLIIEIFPAPISKDDELAKDINELFELFTQHAAFMEENRAGSDPTALFNAVHRTKFNMGTKTRIMLGKGPLSERFKDIQKQLNTLEKDFREKYPLVADLTVEMSASVYSTAERKKIVRAKLGNELSDQAADFLQVRNLQIRDSVAELAADLETILGSG